VHQVGDQTKVSVKCLYMSLGRGN